MGSHSRSRNLRNDFVRPAECMTHSESSTIQWGDAEVVTESEYEVGPKLSSDDGHDSECGISSKRKTNSDFAGGFAPSPNSEPSLSLSRKQNDWTVIGQYRASHWTVIGPVTSLAEWPILFMAMNSRAQGKPARTTS